ncbi:MAG TPA: hypothetical protein VF733_05290 [Candidatus Saccharimonadales bacterium]
MKVYDSDPSFPEDPRFYTITIDTALVRKVVLGSLFALSTFNLTHGVVRSLDPSTMQPEHVFEHNVVDAVTMQIPDSEQTPAEDGLSGYGQLGAILGAAGLYRAATQHRHEWLDLWNQWRTRRQPGWHEEIR